MLCQAIATATKRMHIIVSAQCFTWQDKDNARCERIRRHVYLVHTRRWAQPRAAAARPPQLLLLQSHCQPQVCIIVRCDLTIACQIMPTMLCTVICIAAPCSRSLRQVIPSVAAGGADLLLRKLRVQALQGLLQLAPPLRNAVVRRSLWRCCRLWFI